MGSYRKFPNQESAEALKNDGKLKTNARVRIMKDKWGMWAEWESHSKWQNSVIPSMFGATVYYCLILFFGTETWRTTGIYVGTYFIVKLILDFWLYKYKRVNLGDLEPTQPLLNFLDRFAKGRQLSRGLKKFVKIITLKRKRGTVEWKIEYELLISACRMSANDPQTLGRAIERCRNKEEFRWIAGIS